VANLHAVMERAINDTLKTTTVIKTNNSSVDQDKMLGQTMSPVVHRPGVLLSRRYSLKTWNVNES